jgi:hypothetical protein
MYLMTSIENFNLEFKFKILKIYSFFFVKKYIFFNVVFEKINIYINYFV